MTLQPIPSESSYNVYAENFLFFFITVPFLVGWFCLSSSINGFVFCLSSSSNSENRPTNRHKYESYFVFYVLLILWVGGGGADGGSVQYSVNHTPAQSAITDPVLGAQRKALRWGGGLQKESRKTDREEA
jgi:hypothetical protein